MFYTCLYIDLWHGCPQILADSQIYWYGNPPDAHGFFLNLYTGSECAYNYAKSSYARQGFKVVFSEDDRLVGALTANSNYSRQRQIVAVNFLQEKNSIGFTYY